MNTGIITSSYPSKWWLILTFSFCKGSGIVHVFECHEWKEKNPEVACGPVNNWRSAGAPARPVDCVAMDTVATVAVWFTPHLLADSHNLMLSGTWRSSPLCACHARETQSHSLHSSAQPRLHQPGSTAGVLRVQDCCLKPCIRQHTSSAFWEMNWITFHVSTCIHVSLDLRKRLQTLGNTSLNTSHHLKWYVAIEMFKSEKNLNFYLLSYLWLNRDKNLNQIPCSF